MLLSAISEGYQSSSGGTEDNNNEKNNNIKNKSSTQKLNLTSLIINDKQSQQQQSQQSQQSQHNSLNSPNIIPMSPLSTTSTNSITESRSRFIEQMVRENLQKKLERESSIKTLDTNHFITLDQQAISQIELRWNSRPERVLLIKKHLNETITNDAKTMISWLNEKGIQVLVEPNVAEKELTECEAFDLSNPHEDVDFCICLGGDGTLLHLSRIFNQNCPVPPVICFAKGTLGFLTPLSFNDWKIHLSNIIETKKVVYVIPRLRLRCDLFRAGSESSEDLPALTYQCLNELLLTRGTSPSFPRLELWVDGILVTNIVADGLIVSSPTGSTAYSMSAGGAMVAPSVPAILITPICPESLSFRPLVLPDCSHISVVIPDIPNGFPKTQNPSESKCWASFDGREQTRLQPGDFITIKMSHFPIPSIMMTQYNGEWFDSLTSKLSWNAREMTNTVPPFSDSAKFH